MLMYDLGEHRNRFGRRLPYELRQYLEIDMEVKNRP